MTAVAPALENLTFSVTQEIHVRASLGATFAALLEQMGPANQGHNGAPMPMTLEALARRPLVSRSRRRQRPFLGSRPGHQAADPAGDLRTAVHVVRGRVERAVSALPRVDGGTLITLRHAALGAVPDDYRERPVGKAGRNCSRASEARAEAA